MRLSARACKIDAEAGIVKQSDGSTHYAELVVGADGVHSIARSTVNGDEPLSADTGLSAFLFMLPTKVVRRSSKLSEFLGRKEAGSALLADTQDLVTDRHMMCDDRQE